MKLHLKKTGSINPQTKKPGFVARVVNNGTSTFAELAKNAALNTTVNPIELKAAAELFVEAVARALKDGKAVELGPIGKLYPSCSSGWKHDPNDLIIADVKMGVVYRPSEDVSASIRGCSLVWLKEEPKPDNDDDLGTGPIEKPDNGNPTPDSSDQGTPGASGGGGGTTNPGPIEV